MIDPFHGLVSEADLSWASALMGLGPDGFAPVDGDDSRMKAMLNMETADFEACPGSGKTTLLVAKLGILATRWPYRDRGICVLSHTNAARNEIGSRLSSSVAGVALLRYPHFVGTIHGFVNEYLAIPWLRSKGNPVRMIDTQVALRRRKASLEWRWRTAMEKRHLSDFALSYSRPDYRGGSKGALGPNTDFYNRLVHAARVSSEQGYLCFDEMFVWANELLDRRPETVETLRYRFPLLFVDEAQDNSEEQSALLYRVFNAGDAPARRQRFGDSNQAIYARPEQGGAATDPFPTERKHDIPRSYRFSQALADTVKGFGVVPQALAGAGPSGTAIGGGARPHTLFLFDDASVEQVLAFYGDLLIASFDERALETGLFTAVAGVHEMDELDRIPRAMGHYAPFYDAGCVRKEGAPTSFAQHLAKARFNAVGTGNAHGIVNALAAAMLALGELAGAPPMTTGGKSPHKLLLDVLGETEARRDYLALMEIVLARQGDVGGDVWLGGARQLAERVALALSDAAILPAPAVAFLAWPDAMSAMADQENRIAANIFCHPRAAPKVRIRLSSIHAVKGETHTATLVLDSFFHRHHLSELKPWLLGERSGGASVKKGKLVMEGARMLGRLKLHYVAMTRPTHLLCLAMRRDAIEDAELALLEKKGWKIIDCCEPRHALPSDDV